MTDAQLAEIEAAVGFALPPEYRWVALDPPFRAPRDDRIYWFIDGPAGVIEATLTPLADSQGEVTGWRPGYLGFGYGPGGDVYVLDTAAEGLPVHCLSHETLAVELNEWPTFAAYVEDWLQFPRRCAEQEEAERLRQRSELRWALKVFGVIMIVGTVPAALLMLVAHLAK